MVSKGLDALNNMYVLLKLHNLQNDNDFLAIEKELKALEIIKKYPRCSLQRVIAFIQDINEGYITLTEEHLHNRDIPYTIDEFNLIKEVLL